MTFKKHAKERASEDTRAMRVDVWLVGRQSLSRTSSLSLALQLATVLRRTDVWSKNTTLRVVRLVETRDDVEREGDELRALLERYRFEADILVLSVIGERMHPIAAALDKQARGRSGGHGTGPGTPTVSRFGGTSPGGITGLSVRAPGSTDADDGFYLSEHPAVVNEQVRYNCVSTCVCFMALPDAPGIDASSGGDSRESPTRSAVAEDAAYIQRIDMLTRGLPPTVLVGATGSTEFVTEDL